MAVGHGIGEKTVFFASINSGKNRDDDADDECETVVLGSGCLEAGFGFSALTQVKDMRAPLVRSLAVVVNKVKQILMNARSG